VPDALAMVGLISSTIFPADTPAYGGPRSVFTPEQRLEQTLQTIECMRLHGVERIFLIDNSGANWKDWVDPTLLGIAVRRVSQYPFNNKGIGECMLLHQSLQCIPEAEAILKLSARYTLLADVQSYLGTADIAGRMLRAADGREYFHTSCYVVRNACFLSEWIDGTIYEHYAYYARIRGLRSLARLLTNSMFPWRRAFFFHDPPDPIEFAAARALRKRRADVVSVGIPIATGLAGAHKGCVHVH